MFKDVQVSLDPFRIAWVKEGCDVGDLITFVTWTWFLSFHTPKTVQELHSWMASLPISCYTCLIIYIYIHMYIYIYDYIQIVRQLSKVEFRHRRRGSTPLCPVRLVGKIPRGTCGPVPPAEAPSNVGMLQPWGSTWINVASMAFRWWHGSRRSECSSASELQLPGGPKLDLCPCGSSMWPKLAGCVSKGHAKPGRSGKSLDSHRWSKHI